MKKYIYYSFVILEVIVLIAIVCLSVAYPVIFADFWQAFLCITIGIPSVILCCIAIEKTNISFQKVTAQLSSNNGDQEEKTKEDKEDKNGKPQDDYQNGEDKEKTNFHEEQNEATDNEYRKKWSEEMYKNYSRRWDEIFNEISYPVTAEESRKISLLLWEMASLTNDFLKVDNKDVNKLLYQDNNIKLLIGEIGAKDMNLKDFYDDPNTVEKKAIAIYHWLNSQGVKENTTAFGYQLNLE